MSQDDSPRAMAIRMRQQQSPPEVINGVRLGMVAKLVGNHEDLTATPREREIATKVRRFGEEMERRGYLPALRRRQMMRVMMEEAQVSYAPAQNAT